MNPMVTTKDSILEKSRTLIMQKGWNAIHVRSVASACGVSIGTIYNYFGSKSGLLTATIESIWEDIFQLPQEPETFEHFLSCIEWVYERIAWGNQTYPGFFLLHAMSFLGEEKTEAKQKMSQTWRHMEQGFQNVLKMDKQIRPDAFTETFTREHFANIVFSMILASFFQENQNPSPVIEVIKRVIY